MNRTTLIAAGLLLGVSLATTACEPAAEAEVTEQGSATVESPTESPTEEAVEEEAPATATVGDTVTIGDWDVKVTDVRLNADRVIAEANMFNDKPKRRFVLVTYEATYHGPERKADTEMDLTWTVTNETNKVLDQTFAVTPHDDAPTEARQGGTITGEVVFDTDSVALVSVEDWENYADFTLAR